jgi:hypothetical protein
LRRHTSRRKGRAGGSPGPVRCKLCEAQQCKYWIHCVFFSFFLLVVADLFREYYLRPRKDSRVTTAEDGRRLKEERKPFGTHFFVKFDFTAQLRL